MNPVNALSVQRAVESYLHGRLSTSLTEVAKAVYGLDPSRLDRAQFGMLISSMKRTGWRERRDHVTRAKFWRGPQQAGQTPISAPEDIDAQADTGRQWAA